MTPLVAAHTLSQESGRKEERRFPTLATTASELSRMAPGRSRARGTCGLFPDREKGEATMLGSTIVEPSSGKPNFYLWLLFAAFLVCIVLPPGSAGRVADAAEGAIEPQVVAAFDELEAYILGLAPVVLEQGIANSLAKKVGNAGAAYLRGQPCTSVNVLDAYLNQTSALLGGPHGSAAENLYYRGLLLRSDVLAGVPDDQPCPHDPPDAECAGDAPWAELLPTTLSYAPRSIAENDGTFVEVTVSNRGGLTATDVVVAVSSPMCCLVFQPAGMVFRQTRHRAWR